MGVVACNSREFLGDSKGEGLFRAGDEDRRGEVDLCSCSTSSIEVELLCLAEELGEV